MEIQKFSVSSEFWYCFMCITSIFNSIFSFSLTFINLLYWIFDGFYLTSNLTQCPNFYLISAELTEMMGDLFIGHDMPEPPKESFFKGLFGGGSRSLDREELCK